MFVGIFIKNKRDAGNSGLQPWEGSDAAALAVLILALSLVCRMVRVFDILFHGIATKITSRTYKITASP